MIIQHPSTPDWKKDPRPMLEECMKEFFPIVIASIGEYGVDIEDEQFQRDFTLVVDIMRALLWRQVGLEHPLHVGMSILNNEEKKDE